MSRRNDRVHLTNALMWWNRSLVIQTIMSIGWISEKSGNFGITYRSAKALTNKPAAAAAAVALTFENARRSITKRYNGAVYYLNNEKPSNGIAARRGAAGFCRECYWYSRRSSRFTLKLAERRKPLHNAVADTNEKRSRCTIEYRSSSRSRASRNDTAPPPLHSVHLISSSRFAK